MSPSNKGHGVKFKVITLKSWPKVERTFCTDHCVIVFCRKTDSNNWIHLLGNYITEHIVTNNKNAKPLEILNSIPKALHSDHLYKLVRHINFEDGEDEIKFELLLYFPEKKLPDTTTQWSKTWQQ